MNHEIARIAVVLGCALHHIAYWKYRCTNGWLVGNSMLGMDIYFHSVLEKTSGNKIGYTLLFFILTQCGLATP